MDTTEDEAVARLQDEDSFLLTIPEAAERLRLSRSTLYLMVGRGELPVVRIGKAMRVPTDAVREWVARNASQVAGV